MHTFNLISYLITAILGFLLCVLLYLKSKYNYWVSRGVYNIEPHLIYGNFKKFFKGQKNIGDVSLDIYAELKSKALRFGGAYLVTSPVLIPLDPSIIKSIIQTDFDHFTSHGTYINEEIDPLTGHLFNLDGAKWRTMRAKLTPTFTSGKMKMMFETLVTCTEGLKELIDEQTKHGEEVEMSEILARFTTNVIGSCAFGLECNSMKDPNSDFRKYGKRSFLRANSSFIKTLARKLLPTPLTNYFRLKLTQPDVEKFFMDIVRETVQYREKNNLHRKDFMHLLIQLKNRGTVSDDEKITGNERKENTITMNELTAQCFVFFAAGFDTSSTAMSYALYELATNQEIQEKLREEITEISKKFEGKLTYEMIKNMAYLDRVVQETLRMYPPVPILPRVCNKEYKIPGSDVTITPKVLVHIPVFGLHRDPDYYPDPEIFDPDRFTEENKAKRPQCTFLPFGEGPRICIGLRFGLMQTKVGLVSILKNYKVTLSNKTKIPFTFEPRKNIISVQGGIWLNVSKI